jgi:hypothetical protein
VINAAGAVAGGLIRYGAEAILAARAAAAAEVVGVVSKATSTVGDQSVTVTSRKVAEQAAKEWVGEGAEPIYASRGSGPQVGWKSENGTKIARFTSAATKGYINLVNKVTGGNLHVRW